jgi:hypothetical protein
MSEQPDPNEELTLIVDYDAEIGTHYVIVLNKRTGEELLFRPGFRTHEKALDFGDAWLQENGFVVKGSE